MKKMSIAYFSILPILSLTPIFCGALENNGGYTISDVTVRQRWPWDRKVDIDFFITRPDGAPADRLVKIGVAATNASQSVVISDASLSDQYCGADGAYRFVWDPSVNHNGKSFGSLSMTLSVTETNLTPTYMTVNLDSGALAYYPASFSNTVNADLYKTDYMAFRRCPATTSAEWIALKGTNYYTMGAPESESRISAPPRESQTNVILTQDFYLGVFEVTQRQYQKLTAARPSYYKNTDWQVHPVETVTYETIRGEDVTYRWPTTSEVDSSKFMGLLRARTGKDFDLPTEQQWKYACRAGTTDARYFPDSLVTNYLANTTNVSPNTTSTVPVGTLLPNPWGFYDMYDNVHEMVLTIIRMDDGNTYYLPYGGTNPVGPLPTSSYPYRGLRGTHYYIGGLWPTYCRSAYRYANPVNGFVENNGHCIGFRLCLTGE